MIFDPSDAATKIAYEHQGEVTTTALPPFFDPVRPMLLTQQPTEAKGRSWNWYVILALGVGVVFGAGIVVIILLLLIKM